MQMWVKNILLLFIILSLTSVFAFPQQTPAKKDSTHLYKNIETYSKRSKFTKLMYSLVFKPVAIIPAKKKKYKKLIVKPYSAFEGKIIRHIEIITLDPFGYSIRDTLVAPQNFLSKTGNNLHIKSLPITIRNLLLIRKNQVFDSLLVKESERLVRSKNYILDVSFFVKTTALNSDSVDIFIRALDIWSIYPKGSASPSGITIDLTDQNFLGLGHTFENVYTGDYAKGVTSLITNYSIPNIKNTYIGAKLHFDILGHENFNRGFAIDRPFFSPFAKWAAGVSFTQQFQLDSVRTSSSLFVPQRFRFNVQDYWAGNAIQLFKGNSEYDRTTNFISSVRFLRIRYLEKPSELIDTLQRYSSENFFMASIGLSTRKYVLDKYIFKFGVTEDVPIGKAFSLTGGYQLKSSSGRIYLGARFSIGNYNSWGYLVSNIEYGTFFEASHAQQGILTAGINYFTGLMEIGKWKFRQFVKPQITIGINRFSYDTLTINDSHGLDGFNSTGLSGTRRILLTLQTQAYTPWNFIGFRFGPFFTCTMGMLGDSFSGFKNSKVYSQIGMGVLIKNENLVFNAFQLSIAFYPSIPGMGQNVFKTNSFRTTDFGFRDFDIGKPGIVIFQ
jgi:hypothetical protein